MQTKEKIFMLDILAKMSYISEQQLRRFTEIMLKINQENRDIFVTKKDLREMEVYLFKKILYLTSFAISLLFSAIKIFAF